VPRSRWLPTLLVLTAACAGDRQTAPSGRSLVTLPEAEEGEASASTRSARASCAIQPPRVEERQLDALVHLGDHAGKTWLLAGREPSAKTALLLHLDAAGRLVENELPAFTEHVSFEAPSLLHFLEYAETPRWWSVDISDRDGPKVGKAEPGPPLGWAPSSAVKAFAVSAARAFVSVYRVEYGDAGTTRRGETGVFDRASGSRIGSLLPMTAWAAQCLGTRCAALASDNDSDDAQLLVFDGSSMKKTRLGSFGCAGVRNWRDGSKWVLAFGDGERLRALSVDLQTGQVREAASDVLGRECGVIHSAQLAGRRGLLISGERFLPVASTPRIGAPERLPGLSGRSQALAPLPDGAALADFTSESWMTHGPTDSRGMRRYHREWRFSGRAGLLRGTRGGWRLDAGPLPGSGTEGQFSSGLDVNLLSNENFSAAIVSGERPARVVYLTRPCE
jgi:hypothetical protein